MFAMARDNNLPCSRALAKVQAETRTPILPAVVTGALAIGILLVNVNLPHIIETLCSVAIVWANLAYLLVTLPLLAARFRGWPDAESSDQDSTKPARSGRDSRGPFSLGRFGLPINLIAVVWGIAVIVNVSWPRPAIYGSHPWGRYAAALSTLVIMGVGAVYRGPSRRRRTGILPEHAAEDPLIEAETGTLSHQFT
jgi:amino acid transporter